MKLLTRTRNASLLLSAGVMLTAIPVFYFVLNHLLEYNVDETLRHRKQFIVQKLPAVQSAAELRLWQQFDDDVVLTPTARLPARDSLFNLDYYDSLAREAEPCRALVTGVRVHGQPYRLLIRVSLVERDELLQTVVGTMAALLGLLLAGLLLINQRLSRTVWRPFHRTLAQLRDYHLASTAPLALPPTPIAEFSELNAAIGQMTAQIHRDYRSLKQFTENASHEIQTPLAIIRGKLELMMQTDTGNASHMRDLQAVYEAAGRLSKLNQALLLLTKIENRQFSHPEPIDLRALVEHQLGLYEDFIRAKDLRVVTHLAEATVRMNRELARILVSNLLGNAIKHNCCGGALSVVLTAQSLTLANAGEPPRVPPAQFFERFQKAHPDSDSLGLGLAIVREIGDNAGLRLHYDYADGQHCLSVAW